MVSQVPPKPIQPLLQPNPTTVFYLRLKAFDPTIVATPIRKYNGTILAQPNKSIIPPPTKPFEYKAIDTTSVPNICLEPSATEDLSAIDILEINTIIARSKARRDDARLHAGKSFQGNSALTTPSNLFPTPTHSAITDSTTQQANAKAKLDQPRSPTNLGPPHPLVSPTVTIPVAVPPEVTTTTPHSLTRPTMPIQLQTVKKEKNSPPTPEKTARKYIRKTKPLTLL